MLRLAHKNNRKTTRGRLTQVINVPKYIVSPTIKDKEKLKLAKATLLFALTCRDSRAINEILKAGAIVSNPNKHAGRSKVVYHKPTMK